MAEPMNFPEANIRMNAPEDMENCDDTVAFKGPDQVITCWKLSPEELESVKTTGVVWLHLAGSTMQPAYIGADNPFQEVSDEQGD